MLFRCGRRGRRRRARERERLVGSRLCKARSAESRRWRVACGVLVGTRIGATRAFVRDRVRENPDRVVARIPGDGRSRTATRKRAPRVARSRPDADGETGARRAAAFGDLEAAPLIRRAVGVRAARNGCTAFGGAAATAKGDERRRSQEHEYGPSVSNDCPRHGGCTSKARTFGYAPPNWAQENGHLDPVPRLRDRAVAVGGLLSPPRLELPGQPFELVRAMS